MNSLFLPEHQDILSRDMQPTTTLAFTLFFSSCVAGFYFYDLLKKSKATDDRLQELEHVVHESASLQESQSDILEEHEHRIREKVDYDESSEIEEGKYQCWKGICYTSGITLQIKIWREKSSTLRKNQEWVNWNGEPNGSCIVRDFYLGNSNPDFSWSIHDNSTAEVSDTLINGWDSVCKIYILIKKDGIQEQLDYNKFLKKCIEEKSIAWSRILIEA